MFFLKVKEVTANKHNVISKQLPSFMSLSLPPTQNKHIQLARRWPVMRDTAHPSHPLPQGEVRAHRFLPRPCSNYGYKTQKPKGRQQSIQRVAIIPSAVPISTLPKVHWRNSNTVVPKNTQVKIVPWKGNSPTDGVFMGISSDRVTQQLIWESLKVVGRNIVLWLPQEPELVLCHWPASLPYMFYT